MATGRSHPSIVMDVQVLVTPADGVATMAREVGHPRVSAARRTGVISSRNEGRLPGLADRWASSGIAAQVVLIPPRGADVSRQLSYTIIPPRADRDISTPETGLICQIGPCMAPPPTGETRMSAPTDPIHEGHDQTAPPPTDARGPEGTLYAPPETEASFEEIER